MFLNTWTDEQKTEWMNEVIALTDNQTRMEELTKAAQNAMTAAGLNHWSLGQQFNLMAYNNEITGPEHQALMRYHRLPGRLF